MGEFSFPKHYHLRRPSDFQKVYGRGQKRHTRGFVLFRLPNDLEYPRLGLSVSRRFGNAVRRNRMKRLIREAVRLHWKDWKLEGKDIVVIPKKGAGRYCFSDITTEFHNTFHIKEQGGRRC